MAVEFILRVQTTIRPFITSMMTLFKEHGSSETESERKMKLTIDSAIAAVVVYLLAFVSLPFIAWRQQLLLIAILVIFFIRYARTFIGQIRAAVVIPVMAYGIYTFFASFLNRNQPDSFLLTPLIFATSIGALFLYMEYARIHNQIESTVTLYYWMTLAICLLNDALAVGNGIGADGNYLLGNKFPASYLHLILAAFAYHRYVYRRNATSMFTIDIRFFALYAYAVFACSYFGCNTAAVGGIIMGVMYCFQRYLLPIVRRPLVTTVTLLICDTLLLINSAIISWAPIRNFIVDNLNKSADLTGRMPIYQQWREIINAASWHGVGMENSYAFSMQLTGAADVQNGLLHIILSSGCLGAILFLSAQYLLLLHASHSINASFLVMAYAFIYISIVEVPFNKVYFAVLALIIYTASSSSTYKQSTSLYRSYKENCR